MFRKLPVCFAELEDFRFRSEASETAFILGYSGFPVKKNSPQKYRVRRGVVQDAVFVRFSQRPPRLDGAISEPRVTRKLEALILNLVRILEHLMLTFESLCLSSALV